MKVSCERILVKQNHTRKTNIQYMQIGKVASAQNTLEFSQHIDHLKFTHVQSQYQQIHNVHQYMLRLR